MIGPGNAIVQRVLDRLFATMASGPSLNCRPHSSRQRVYMMQLDAFEDLSPVAILRGLLADRTAIVVKPRVPRPPKTSAPRETGNGPDPAMDIADVQAVGDVEKSAPSADYPDGWRRGLADEAQRSPIAPSSTGSFSSCSNTW